MSLKRKRQEEVHSSWWTDYLIDFPTVIATIIMQYIFPQCCILFQSGKVWHSECVLELEAKRIQKEDLYIGICAPNHQLLCFNRASFKEDRLFFVCLAPLGSNAVFIGHDDYGTNHMTEMSTSEISFVPKEISPPESELNKERYCTTSTSIACVCRRFYRMLVEEYNVQENNWVCIGSFNKADGILGLCVSDLFIVLITRNDVVIRNRETHIDTIRVLKHCTICFESKNARIFDNWLFFFSSFDPNSMVIYDLFSPFHPILHIHENCWKVKTPFLTDLLKDVILF